MTDEFLKRGRRFQFSLRTFLIAIVVFSLPLCWFTARLERARRQAEAVDVISAMGGGTWREWEPHGAKVPEPKPTWMRHLLGDDFFYPIVLAVLPANATDDDLEYLKALRGIQSIALNETQITDAGLEQFQGLNGIRWLRLDHTQITDIGLAHLEKVTSLEFLILNNTQVTPEGVEKLQRALPNCKIEY